VRPIALLWVSFEFGFPYIDHNITTVKVIQVIKINVKEFMKNLALFQTMYIV